MNEHKDFSESAAGQILKDFESTADSSYKLFLAERVKSTNFPESIIGIRMGNIRKTASALAKVMSYEEVLEHIYPQALKWYEYKLLFGLLLQRLTPSEKVSEVLPKLYGLCDGWAVPDTFQVVLAHFAKKGNLELILQSIQEYKTSINPFARRLTVVVQMPLVKHGLVSVRQALEFCEEMQWDEEYLVQMGVAWTLSELRIHHPDEVEAFLSKGKISSEDVLKKYKQKLRDSLRL